MNKNPEHGANRPAIFWLTPDRFDLKQDRSSWSEMATQLSHLGWEVSIVTSTSRGADSKACQFRNAIVVPSIDLPFIFRVSTMIASFLVLARRSRTGDIFIINEDMLWWVPIFRLLGRRHIHLDVRTVPVSPLNLKERITQWVFWTRTLRLLSRSVDSYSFITSALKDAFENAAGIRVRDYCVWASGVNTRLFRPVPGVNTSHPRAFNVFYHGSIRFVRGLGELVRAMKDPSIPREATLTIVGEGPDRPALEKLVVELGLCDRVVFKGPVPYETIPAEIAAADVCICPLPDRPEWNVSSPLKVLEYMACCKPVILTPIPAHREIAERAPFVVWARDHQPASLAESIARAAGQRDELERCAGEGRAIVKSRFEWAHHARTLESHLRASYVSTGQPGTEP